MDDNELIAVFNAVDEIQALLYRSMLEEAGIDVIERPWETGLFEGVEQRGLHSQLLVREEDVDKASTLVTAFRHDAEEGELALDGPEDTSETSAS